MHISLAVKRQILPSGERPRRVLRGPARGVVFELDLEHHLRFWLGLYEAEIVHALRRFVTPGRHAYDVGADIGFQALTLARLSGTGVVAFEPNQHAIEAIQRNLRLNPNLPGPVHLVQGLVGDRDEPPQRKLDTYVDREAPFRPDVLLIDVDGAEVEVLRGAHMLLRQQQPDLIIETHDPELERQCIDLLRLAGYAPRIVGQRRLFPDFRPIPHNRWLVAAGASAKSGTG